MASPRQRVEWTDTWCGAVCIQFEEVDGASISGLVSMEFELYETKTGKVVWSHYYSQ